MTSVGNDSDQIKQYVIDDNFLMSEWDWENNNKLGLDPSKIKLKSDKKPYWICQYGHRWQTSVSHRTNGTNCPYCSGRLAIPGETDLATINPSLAAEWHPTKNGDLTPRDVKPQSNKKVLWLCSNGHEYESRICTRVTGQGCPYCIGKRVWIGFNDLSTTNPELVLEWNFEKNTLLPTMITKGSNKKVWWKCRTCGHEWQATSHNRSKGRGCPECAKIKRKQHKINVNFMEESI